MNILLTFNCDNNIKFHVKIYKKISCDIIAGENNE